MNAHRLVGSGRSEQELEEAMQQLAATIRDAGECLLDLQVAVEALRMANEPGLAREVQQATAGCLRSAMRR
jgi:hypothetical protein